MIGSILKAIDILSLFDSYHPRMSLAEISERSGLPKSTAHSILATLQARGLIEKVDSDSYAVGNQIIVLAQSARVNIELRDRAARYLRLLADACHESVYLTVREQDHVLYIYAVESPHRLLARTAVGERVLMHCTANGKSIMASLPESEIEAYVKRVGLQKYTKNTIVTLDGLKKELEMTRQCGYAVDNEEHEPGIYCIGVPIYDGSSRVIGACSISGVDREILGSRLQLLIPQILYTAQEISRTMGFVPSMPSQIITSPKNEAN
ncbi:MAG: IclR family transcriptional regulator [Chloroflexi bacterium]|nr:IclR family transcriptional regulator [Chloroflexota bacterium]